MSYLDPSRRAIITDCLLASPVAVRLGLRLEASGRHPWHLRLPFDAANVTEGTMVHGGVIATLIDVVAVAGSVAATRETPSAGATANLAITYLAPADGCDLIATPRSLRAGKRQHVVRVEVTDPDGCEIAEALATVLLS